MALILVLITVGLAAALAAAFLGLAGVRAMTSQNLTASAEAKALAESGLAEAAYFLSYPHVVDPSQPDAIWTGVVHRQLDPGISDYYDVSVTVDAADPLRVTATSTAHIFGTDTERYSRTVRETYLVNRGFSHALMADRNLYIPVNVTVNGNVYAKGLVQNYGTVNGNIQANSTISGSGTVTGKTIPNFPSLDLSSCSLPNPVTYLYNGTVYTAEEITDDTLDGKDWSFPSGTNPMGVYTSHGNLTLKKNNKITGTLIVTGNLHLEDDNNIITAKPGFPALILHSNLNLDGYHAGLTINGACLIQKKIIPQAIIDDSVITINGSLVFLGSNSGFDADYFFPFGWSHRGTIIINQDINRTGVKGLFPPNPLTARQVRPISFLEE
jgi:hypothetical protein